MPTFSISWTRRLFERTGLGTAGVGVSLLAMAVGVFLIQEIVLGRFDRQPARLLEDLRLTIIHIVITAYLITATVYCEQARDESIASLGPLIDPKQTDAVLDTKQRDRAILAAAAAAGVALAIVVVLYVTPGPASYDPRSWSPENGYTACSRSSWATGACDSPRWS